MADRGRILPPPAKDAGGNWARESRRSAPSRLAIPGDHLHHTSHATDVRSRLPAARTPISRRSLVERGDASRAPRRSGGGPRRASAVRFGGNLVAEPSEAGDTATTDDGYSQQSPTSGRAGEAVAVEPFSRTETADVGDGNDSDSSYNSFTLRLQKKSLFQADSLGLASMPTLDLAKLAKDALPAAGEDKNFSTTVYRVYRSYYRGNLFKDGELTAMYRTGTNRKMFQHELSKPLFRWVHVENPTMSFNNFTKVALDCPWLDNQHRPIIEDIFKVARGKSERSLSMPAGKKGAYVEPEYYEQIVNQTVYQGFRSRRDKTEYIRWMCIPYFYVRDTTAPASTKKTGTGLSELDGPSFPLAPMNTGYVLDCKWFQVAQLWVLVVGENLLITCARRSVDDLAGKINDLNEKVIDIKVSPPAPSPQLRNIGDRAPVIVVSDGGIRTWLLPIDKCETWSEFCSNFAELGINFFEGWNVVYRDFKMTQKDWSKLVAIAHKVSVRLRLEKRGDDDSDSDTIAESDTDDEDPEIRATAGAVTPSADVFQEPLSNSDPSKTSWHVFTLMATIPFQEPNAGDTADALRLDSTVLHEDANEINYYLSELNRRHGEVDSYLNCREASFSSVQEFAKTLTTEPDREGINADKIHLFRAARHIFSFFYPLTFNHLVARKFWGAVDRILRDDYVATRKFVLQSRVKAIRSVHHAVDYIKEELFFKRTPAYNQTNVPHEFIQAWLMILMWFVLFPTQFARKADSYPKRCQALLTQGMVKVIKRLQTDSLRDRESVSAIGTTALLVGQLLENARGNINFPDRQRLMKSYWSDLQRLTLDVHSNPLSRKFQEQFLVLKSEFELLTRSIEEQQRVLVAFEDSINEGEANSVIPAHSLQDQGRELNIIEYCLQNTEATLFNFAAMERKRGDLESWHFRTIETVKDRQEKAALTFTTVTVFFLPLTMLASVFGMNTSDIRNMSEGQWLFWATAVPMCGIGLLLWLAYLGTLLQWYKALKNLGRAKAVP